MNRVGTRVRDKQVGGEHREHDRLGQRREQIAGDPGEEEHRHEHDADAQRRDKRRHRDLGGPVEDGPVQVGTQVNVAFDVLDRDGRVVDQDPDPPSARPPSVMMLMVSPSAYSARIDARIESGIDTAMMQVLRQFPRNSRIIAAVRQAAISALALRHRRSRPSRNSDWSNSGRILHGRAATPGPATRQHRAQFLPRSAWSSRRSS